MHNSTHLSIGCTFSNSPCSTNTTFCLGNSNKVKNQSRSNEVHRIAEDPERNLEIFAFFGSSCSLFQELKQVRSNNGDKVLEHPFDMVSTHYLMRWKATPVGALTATAYASGLMDCALLYPQILLQVFPTRIFSFVKNRVNRFEHTSSRTFRWFTSACWNDQATFHGMRFDIVNVEASNRERFERIGYVCLDFDFIHPLLGTNSRTMLLAADGSRPSWFREIFQNLESQVSLEIALSNLGLDLKTSESSWRKIAMASTTYVQGGLL